MPSPNVDEGETSIECVTLVWTLANYNNVQGDQRHIYKFRISSFLGRERKVVYYRVIPESYGMIARVVIRKTMVVTANDRKREKRNTTT